MPGPLDVIGDSGAGVLHTDLQLAALAALEIAPERALGHARHFTWEACAAIFLSVAEQARC